jgi:hypothetical protein
LKGGLWHPSCEIISSRSGRLYRAEKLVITELVINHTSDEHPWFKRALEAPKGSARRNFYVWSDTRTSTKAPA